MLGTPVVNLPRVAIILAALAALITATALGTLWALTQSAAGAPSSVVSTRFAAAPSDGTVKSEQKISEVAGGFTGDLDVGGRFGISVATIGDLDDDGVPDIAVGADWDADGSERAGAVWVLFLNADGTVKAHQKISATQGGFTGDLVTNISLFGHSVAGLGDLNVDGVQDLAVGASLDSDGAFHAGAVWVLFLNADGTVKAHQKISATQGGFTGELDEFDTFGISVASLGDLDGGGI